MKKETKQKINKKEEIIKEIHPLQVGLEIHGYLNSKEKLFCKCSSHGEKEEKANTRICPICTGQPGCKPMMPNKEAMNKLIQISLVLGCKINHDKKLIWQRKHYNWADLPKGYQNTISGAYSIPCAENGKFKGIRIRECHLEEDPAKWDPETGKIDYNRSGLPLIEIVTEPDFHSANQVEEWLRNLVQSLSYIKALKKEGIKVDTNVSTYGDRAEIKNINSIDNIIKAINYEKERQIQNYEKGEEQKRETLAYNEKTGKTIKMRDKESAEDYRFIPEPDLPIIKLDEKEVKEIERNLPETPDEKLNKLINKYKIDEYNADILSKNLDLVDFFEKLSEKVDAKKYISWITIELLRILNYNRKQLDDPEVDIKPEHLAELIQAIDKKEIIELKAKQIMNGFFPKSYSIKEIKKDIQKLGEKETQEICKKVINLNKKSVADFKAGKKEAFNFLLGEVMKLSNRRADYNLSRSILERLL